MKPIWLEQKVYELASADGSKLNLTKKPNLQLVINGEKQEIPIEQLFINKELRYYPESNEIKGYSLIQKLSISKEGLLKDDLKITFIDIDSGKNIIIFKMSNPAIQLNDKSIPQEEFDKAIEVLKSLQPKPQATMEEPVLVTEEPVISSVVEEQVVNEDYNLESKGLIEQGFKEYKTGEYRLLIKDNQVILVAIEGTGPDDYKTIKTEKTEMPNVWKFVNQSMDRVIKLVDGQLILEAPKELVTA